MGTKPGPYRQRSRKQVPLPDYEKNLSTCSAIKKSLLLTGLRMFHPDSTQEGTLCGRFRKVQPSGSR